METKPTDYPISLRKQFIFEAKINSSVLVHQLRSGREILENVMEIILCEPEKLTIEKCLENKYYNCTNIAVLTVAKEYKE